MIFSLPAGKYHSALAKNRAIVPEKVPTQSVFQFHVVNINTPMSTSSSPRSDHVHSPTYSRNMYSTLCRQPDNIRKIKEEPTSPPRHHYQHPLTNDADRPQCYY